MARLVFASLLIVGLAMASPVEAAAPRSSLPGFGGIAFGTSFEEAQQELGSTFKASSKEIYKAPFKERVLEGNVPLYGGSFRVRYDFGADNRLNEVELSDNAVNLQKTGVDVCQARWKSVSAGLIADYGTPDKTEDHAPGQTLRSYFADKNHIAAFNDYFDYALGCVLNVLYYTPEGEKAASPD